MRQQQLSINIPSYILPTPARPPVLSVSPSGWVLTPDQYYSGFLWETYPNQTCSEISTSATGFWSFKVTSSVSAIWLCSDPDRTSIYYRVLTAPAFVSTSRTGEDWFLGLAAWQQLDTGRQQVRWLVGAGGGVGGVGAPYSLLPLADRSYQYCDCDNFYTNQPSTSKQSEINKMSPTPVIWSSSSSTANFWHFDVAPDNKLQPK